MSRPNIARLILTVLLCALASAGESVFAQAAPQQKPVPSPTPIAIDIQATATQVGVDATIPDDPAFEKMLAAYSPKVRALDSVIGKLTGDLRKGGTGAGSLGNFVTDGLRARASQKLGKPIVLAVTNGGGLRKNVIAAGDLRLRDVFELLPFENALVAFDLTGAQVLDLLKIVLTRRDAQSGARIKYRINAEKKPEIETVGFVIDGVEKAVDPAAVYTVVSIDYLLNVAGGDYGVVLKQAQNIRPLGLTMRDAITDYVKAETAAGREIKSAFDGRFALNKETPGAAEEMPND
ncbi:MAG TPA: 5'-nucleotidase C-terminal domain-containing protein [Pyrinomonadaceae bacterium]|nr:5'-nucleotidase C-terminal domain-containing protein [Pyrinomonadaceae bacterium]